MKRLDILSSSDSKFSKKLIKFLLGLCRDFVEYERLQDLAYLQEQAVCVGLGR